MSLPILEVPISCPYTDFIEYDLRVLPLKGSSLLKNDRLCGFGYFQMISAPAPDHRPAVNRGNDDMIVNF